MLWPRLLGGRTSTTEAPSAESAAPAGSPAAPAVQAAKSRPVRRLLIRGTVVFVVAAAASAVLSAILIFAAASAIATALGGTSGGSSLAPTQATGQFNFSDLTSALHALFAFTAYTFFASHFAPLEASGLGGATYSVIGVGSLTIPIVVVALSFVFARQVERQSRLTTVSAAFGRAFLMAVPFEIGVLALYFPSFVSVGSEQLGISLHPSGFALVIPAALVGAGAGMGAVSVHSVKATALSSVARGVGRAFVAIFVGMLVTAFIAALWLAVELLTQAPASSSSPGGSISPAAQGLGWSVVALIPFYIGNVMSLTWTGALAGTLFSASPLHPLIYIGPLVGVLVGSLLLSQRSDRIEQSSYAAAFGLVTALVAVVTTPAILNGPSLLPLGWTGFVTALLLGVVAALGGPYLQTLGPFRVIAGRAPITWVSRPLLAIWPLVVDQPIQSPGGSGALAFPSLRFGRTQIGIAVALVVLVGGGLVGNAQLTTLFSPEAAAVNYLTAESHGDAATMWSMVTYESNSPTTSPLLSEDALRKMLTYGANTDLKNITVGDSARIDDANYSVTIGVSRGGVATTIRLHLRRDTSRSNWVIYPFWRVIVPASDLQITTFLHAGQVTVDGLNAGLADQGGTVEVIPGDHDVTLAPTDIFTGDDRQVDASNNTEVTFKALLTTTASAAVTSAIGTLFARCSAAQQVAPAGCPNRAFALGDHQSHVHWTLVGDPTASMQLSIADQSDTIEARGDWEMRVSYDYWYDFDATYVEHLDEDLTGVFDDTLHWNGSGFDITNQGGF